MSPFVCTALSGILMILSFPRFDLGPLAWISLVPLLIACRNTSPGRAFMLGWITGLIAFTGIVYWIVIAMHQYGNIAFLPSVMILGLFAAYLGLYVGVFSTLMAWFLNKRHDPSLLVWIAPPTWTALELLRAHLFTGFPWAQLGYSQYQWLSIIQIADLTGVYGVSFLIVLVNAWLAGLIHALERSPHHPTAPSRMIAPSVIAVALTAAAVFYGEARVDAIRHAPDTRGVRLGLVQANIDQGRKWDPAFRRETMDRYHRLTTQAVRSQGPRGIDLIIWPEAATPFVFALEEPYRHRITELARSQRTALLFGSVAVRGIAEATPQLLNRAYLLSAQGAMLNHYDKIHLVPFGEYVPRFLPFLHKLAHGIGDYVPGDAHTVMSGPRGRFGIAICFEVIYPDVVRTFVKQGAEYMVTITNDAWYDRSSAPYQHFSMVVFRAIENRVAFARAANTGISGFIDADGSIKRTTNLFEPAAIVDTVTLGYDRTVYTTHGDIFAHACAAFTLASMLWTCGRNRRA